MRDHFREQLDRVQSLLTDEAASVEQAIRMAVRAFVTRDAKLAGRVIDGDRSLNQSEVELERLCFEMLATQQPAAVDLRFLLAALRINSELERMGDLASNLAKYAWRMSSAPDARFSDALEHLGDSVRGMVTGSIGSFLQRAAALAREIWARDEDVDRQYRRIRQLAADVIRESATDPTDATYYVMAAHALERIGDHATNIVEDVVFLVEGQIVRHNVEARIAPVPPTGI